MKEVDQKFIDAVSALFIRFIPHTVVTGTVNDIDKDNDTCEVLRDEAPTLFKVRLNSIIDGITNKIVVYPKKGSKVQCAIIENDTKEAVIIKYSEIDAVYTKIENTESLVDASGFMIKRGNNDLKQCLNDFITEVQAIIVIQGTSPNVANLEEIRTKLNQILQ